MLESGSLGSERNLFALQGVFGSRSLCVMGMMVALKIALSPLTIWLGPSFKAVTFAYLPGVVVAVLYGPWAALVFGFVADTVGYLAKPMGPYFPGYALSEMVTCFFYALLLYRRPISVWRVVVVRLLTLVVVILGLNYLWQRMMIGAVASKYFSAARLVNNILQLPVYVFCSTVVARLALQIERQLARSRT